MMIEEYDLIDGELRLECSLGFTWKSILENSPRSFLKNTHLKKSVIFKI